MSYLVKIGSSLCDLVKLKNDEIKWDLVSKSKEHFTNDRVSSFLPCLNVSWQTHFSRKLIFMIALEISNTSKFFEFKRHSTSRSLKV
jgi:hypothetical protein